MASKRGSDTHCLQMAFVEVRRSPGIGVNMAQLQPLRAIQE
jgi:hypothetical protein